MPEPLKLIISPSGNFKKESCYIRLHLQVFYFQVNGKIILKSGTDFREFSVLTLTQESKEVHVDIKKVVVDSSFEPDAELKESLSEYEGEFAHH